MKKPMSFLISLILFQTLTFAQQKDSTDSNLKHNISFGLAAFYSPVLSMDLFGIENTFKFYFTKRLATGYCISGGQKKTENTFNYEIQQPLFGHCELGWLNQYDFLLSKWACVGANINNGLLIARLSDNSIKEEYWMTFDGYYYGNMQKAKEIATNYFYFFEPGLNASFLVFSKKCWPSLHITLDTRYRFAFGNSKYAEINDFSNYYISLGLAIASF